MSLNAVCCLFSMTPCLLHKFPHSCNADCHKICTGVFTIAKVPKTALSRIKGEIKAFFDFDSFTVSPVPSNQVKVQAALEEYRQGKLQARPETETANYKFTLCPIFVPCQGQWSLSDSELRLRQKVSLSAPTYLEFAMLYCKYIGITAHLAHHYHYQSQFWHVMIKPYIYCRAVN